MVAVVKGLIDIAATWAGPDGSDKSTRTAKEELFRINDLMNQMKGGADQVNIVSLCRYLKESQLARKISGYAEKLAEDAKENSGSPVEQ
jgi:chromosome transmission fidelity protein 1